MPYRVTPGNRRIVNCSPGDREVADLSGRIPPMRHGCDLAIIAAKF